MRIFKRILLAVLIIGVVLGLASAFAAWWFIYRPMPQTAGSARVPGLTAEATVRRDSLGVPHISAQSLHDLYLAQGYVTAQDRLWQMDTLRRLAGGTLAEVAGETAYRSDADRRMLGMRNIAARAVRSIPFDQRPLFDAYAAGVNAFIAGNRHKLPLEFSAMKYAPQPWTAEDSVLVSLQMFHVLTTTWRDELFKLLLLGKFGPERTAELLVTSSGRDHPPDGQIQSRRRGDSKVQSRLRSVGDTSALAGSTLTSTRGLSESSNARSPESTLDFGPWTLDSPRSNARSPELTLDFGLWTLDSPGLWTLDSPVPGSNNWVVSGVHTASGRAMLANDQHLPYSIPSIWYTVQLQAPGMDVAGVSLPGVPAVIIGHNERIAWGATNLGADVQDLYVEKFDPAHADQYDMDGKWQPAEIHKESIVIRGAANREFTFKATRHGPLVLTENGKSYALRWVAADALTWAFPFFRVNSAHNWGEFRAALADYPGPAQNFVYADTEGNIGYQATGKLPIRQRGDGSVPLDGSDSANDWKGYIPYEVLPSTYNPPSGIIATANARVVPDGYSYPLATKWASPDRTERIYELLNTGRKFQPDDFIRIQTDIFSRHYKTLAAAFAGALEKRRTHDVAAQRLAAQLRQWDGEISAASSEASVVQFARFQVIKALLRPRLGAAYVWYRWPMNSIFLERLVADKPRKWLPEGIADFDEMLAQSVDAGVENLREHFHTADSTRWPWGELLKTSFQHPMAAELPAFLRFGFGVRPFAQAGNGYTVKQTNADFGPSMRMVVDFGDLDGTLLTLAVGESGLPYSAHFKDQFAAWYGGRGLKLPFSEAAVSRESKGSLRLLPSQ